MRLLLFKTMEKILNISLNRNGKKLIVSRKIAKILTVILISVHNKERLYTTVQFQENELVRLIFG